MGGEVHAADSDNLITVGATAVPHAQILNDVVKGLLEAHGWKLDAVEHTDYVQPNTALEEVIWMPAISRHSAI